LKFEYNQTFLLLLKFTRTTVDIFHVLYPMNIL